MDLSRTTATVPYPLPGSQCGWEREREGGRGGRRLRQQYGDRTEEEGGKEEHAGVSKHYYTTFELEVGGERVKLAMVGVHLLARPTDPQRCAEREAQATVLRGVVDGFVEEGYEVIVLGDFNGTFVWVGWGIGCSSALTPSLPPPFFACPGGCWFL